MKKVLIALDYDPMAEKIASTGYSIAKAMGAEVLLLHVVMEPAYYSTTAYSPIMGYTGFNGVDTTAVVEDLKKETLVFLDQCRKFLGDDKIQIEAVEGDFADSITSVATEFNADLIVMGVHHRKGFDKFFMGNLAEKILNTTSIPLLAVPAGSGEQQ